MRKYIIEIEDEPFVRLSALFGEEGLYRAKGFNSLVFDQVGLGKLTPLDKELEEAYLQGRHDAEQDLARAAYKEAYQNGYDEAKRIYQNPNAESDYQRGLDDAWEAARKICNEPEDGGLPAGAVVELFGRNGPILGCSAQNAINKIKAYEEQQKPDLIKVGDEVRSNNAISDHSGIVLALSPGGNSAKVLEKDGGMMWVAVNVLTKTGRHFNFLASLLNAMKEGAE